MKLTVALVALAAALFQQVHADEYCCVSTSEAYRSCGDGKKYCVQLATAGTKSSREVVRPYHSWSAICGQRLGFMNPVGQKKMDVSWENGLALGKQHENPRRGALLTRHWVGLSCVADTIAVRTLLVERYLASCQVRLTGMERITSNQFCVTVLHCSSFHCLARKLSTASSTRAEFCTSYLTSSNNLFPLCQVFASSLEKQA
ncbi:uncharacterized protein RSE6_03124 [Rhynchosporium secalis]|uniref:Uncharacterized protein n=1 Tax=Rhynchosporium secalis TaxID=38038 RepID=A0A1E1M1Z5_RHYSE|nr:uncharacterized protein RSE6_03124 [Rhynchosporium secalis]